MMKQHHVADLDTRIAAAFTPDAKSDDFSSLIADVEAAAKTANETAAASRTRALDPTTLAVEVAAARKQMEDAAFTADRMNVAATRLRDRFRAVTSAEENARRQIAYDRVTQQRDALAKEFAEVYPQLVAKLADLMNRVAANDREIAATKSPEGAPRILEAELVARGLQGFVVNGPPSIVRELRLPAFRHDIHAPYSWAG